MKLNTSAILLGVATATYLFPLFFILPILIFLRKRYNLKQTIGYFLAFAITCAIGIGMPLLIYIINGIPFSQGSVLGGIAGFSISGVSSSIKLSSSTWGLYYIIELATGIVVSFRYTEVIFLISMTVPSFFFIFLRKNYDEIDLFKSLLLLAEMFTLFSLNSAPQYLIVIAPFAILVSISTGDVNYRIFLYLLSLFDITSFFLSMNPFYFFKDTYLDVTQYSLNLPPFLYEFTYSLYIIIQIAFIIYTLKSIITYKEILTKNIKNLIMHFRGKTEINLLTVFLVIVTILTVGIVSPALGNLPNNFYSENALLTTNYHATGVQSTSNFKNYTISLGQNWANLDEYTKINSNYSLTTVFNSTEQGILGDFRQTRTTQVDEYSRYSECFIFSHLLSFKGYFVDFGNNKTPFLYLEKMQNGNPTIITNLTHFVTIDQIVAKTHNFFTFYDHKILLPGKYKLELIFPFSNVTLSSSIIHGNRTEFVPLGYSHSVELNGSSVPTLEVNNTIERNVSLSLYLQQDFSFLLYFNSHLINSSSLNRDLFYINPSYVTNDNIISIDSGNLSVSLSSFEFTPIEPNIVEWNNFPIKNLILSFIFISISVISFLIFIKYVYKNSKID